MITVAVEELLKNWEYEEPAMEDVFALVDRLSRIVISLGLGSSGEATERLRSLLSDFPGYMPSWMVPEFWMMDIVTIESNSSRSVRSYTVLPTTLANEKVEFKPLLNGGVRVSLPDRNLFVVGDNILDAMVGLAKLKESRGKTYAS